MPELLGDSQKFTDVTSVPHPEQFLTSNFREKPGLERELIPRNSVFQHHNYWPLTVTVDDTRGHTE